MIIRWEDSDCVENFIGQENFLHIVSEVLRAHRMGLHLLIIERSLAAKMINLPLSAVDKSILSRISSEYTQTGLLHERSSIYINILNEFTEALELEGNCLNIGLSKLINSRILEKPVLLVENIRNDGGVYEEIIRYACIHAKVGNVAFDCLHGGGEDIVVVSDRLISERRVVCVIVDSDKNSPFSKRSTKEERIGDLIDGNGWPFAFVRSPPCRELENTLPLNVIVKLNGPNERNYSNLILNVMASEDAEGCPANDRWLLFADLKMGISQAQLDCMCARDREWVLGKIRPHVDLNLSSVPGFGPNMVPRVMQDGALRGDLRSNFRERVWRDVFMDFFEGICWVFVSPRRLIT